MGEERSQKCHVLFEWEWRDHSNNMWHSFHFSDLPPSLWRFAAGGYIFAKHISAFSHIRRQFMSLKIGGRFAPHQFKFIHYKVDILLGTKT